MTYVDGFVLPIPRRNLPAYRKMAMLGARAWRDHGALHYVEAVGDDLDVHCGLPFPKGLKLKRGETVVVAFITFRSRAHRDRVNAKVMEDPRMVKMMSAARAPFDPQRMMYGGFRTLVET